MERHKKFKKGDEIRMNNELLNSNTQKVPSIPNTFKIKNIDRFFYEFAAVKGIDVTPFDIPQNDLNLELDMVYHKFFKKEILDTIFITDHKNYLVELSTYSLKNYTIKVPEEIFNQFESTEFLSGKITLEFDKIRGFFYISNFEKWSFDFTLNDYLSSQNFNFISLLQSFGYNNSNLLFREKISLIARLLPCVEKNLNIAEITKPQVGKSFIFDEIMTKNSIVKKLGDLTPTNLFSHINSTSENEAILKNYSILCIDEFHKGDLREIVAGLQTFMENGKVSRGKKSYHSDTSIIMFANFKKDNFYKKIFINSKEFNPFKDISGIDSAFLERIDYINPSFGMRTLNESMFLNESVPRIPISIYQDIFDSLRNIEIDFKKIFPNIKIFNDTNEVDSRISKSIFKTTSGFLKLLFPNTLNNIRNNNLNPQVDFLHIQACFYLAMEGSSFLNVLLKNIAFQNLNINFGENNSPLLLGDSFMYKNIIEYFLGLSSQFFNSIYYPHRYTYQSQLNGIPTLVKIPLDTFGIEENNQENLFYKNIFNLNFLNNNSLVIPQIYTNNFYFDSCNIFFNGSVLYNLIGVKSINRNYLFGYNLIYPQQQAQYSQQFDTTYFGSILFSNNTSINCPKCNNSINLFSNRFFWNIESFISCPYCNQEIFNYDLFPEFFKDYKG